MKNKKEKLVVILLVVGLIVMTVAISYAAFRYTGTGSVLNQITTGSITMSYTESSNVISMTGALPTTDATGKVRLNEGEYFDFTVGSSITGTANINFEIAAQELDGNTIDGSYIKYYLTKVNDDGSEEEAMSPTTYTEETESNEYTGRPANMMSLYTGSMSSTTTTTYRLRIYVDESYNPQGDGGNLIYKTRVNVYGLTGDEISTELAPGLYKTDGTFVSWEQLISTEYVTHLDEEMNNIESNVLIIENGILTTPKEMNDPSGSSAAFSYFEGKLVIDNSITSIDYRAFDFSSNITEVVMSNQLVNIGESAFQHSGLKTITLPNSLENIGYSAFENATNLKTINYNGTTLEWNAIEFGSYWNYGCPEITVHCTDGDIVIPAA